MNTIRRLTATTRIVLLSALSAGLLAGCASGTHTLTGIPHPPLPWESVQLYQTPPPHYEVVGLVTARTRGSSQWRMDQATRKLKTQAGKLGANGIILNPVEHSGLLGRKLNLSGQAIFVLP